MVESKLFGCNVTVKWTTPAWNDCPILFYTIKYIPKLTLHGSKEWTTINVTDPTAHKLKLMLNCSTTYEFRVRAWNDLGGSSFSTKQTVTTGGRKTQAADEEEGETSLLEKQC